jgi:general L-amino acid transport system permease protein
MTAVPAPEALQPPRASIGVLGWLRQNLFSTWYNALLTLLTLWLLYAGLRPALAWMTAEARWEVVTANLRLFMVGQYPADQTWRVWACVYALGLLAGLSWGLWPARFRAFAAAIASAGILLALLPFSPDIRLRWFGAAVAVSAGWLAALGPWAARLRLVAVIAWALFFPFVILIVRGWALIPALPVVDTGLWGGLLLTFLLAIVGIFFSFPLGVLLALGRRSRLPVIRLFATLYIELIRGVPLVTVLYMASIMLPLFLPEQIRVDRVVRAMVGFVLFIAAYVAEDVRGGLQAVPRGQYEAAEALGLPGPLVMGLIVLPQALRNVIPSLVGQFISLFKDTSLVAIIGLFDLLNIGQSVLANPDYLGRHREVYVFAAAIYWVFSYAMSYAARRLEKTLGVGER